MRHRLPIECIMERDAQSRISSVTFMPNLMAAKLTRVLVKPFSNFNCCFLFDCFNADEEHGGSVSRFSAIVFYLPLHKF